MKARRADQRAGRLPVYIMRWGRGRLGGSGLCLQMAQRAWSYGRTVKLRDGDRKSRTLINYYPPREGVAPEDQVCTAPPSEDTEDYKRYVLGDLDDAAEDRLSRTGDVSGGDRANQELMRDLHLPEFCRSWRNACT